MSYIDFFLNPPLLIGCVATYPTGLVSKKSMSSSESHLLSVLIVIPYGSGAF